MSTKRALADGEEGADVEASNGERALKVPKTEGEADEEEQRLVAEAGEDVGGGDEDGDQDPPEDKVHGEKTTGARSASSRRALRPRQVSMRGGRSKFKGKDGDTLLYREGEPLRELSKYLGPEGQEGQNVEIRIPVDYVVSSNRQVRARQLWGSDVYTDDSDLVAVLMHTGYVAQRETMPASLSEIRALIRPLPPQDGYASKSRNGMRSRAWGAGSTCSYRVERAWVVTKSGAQVELEASLSSCQSTPPTFVPATMERTVHTRSSTQNVERRQRFVQEVTVQYNLCNEPWMRYTMAVVADRGLKQSQWTSSRMCKDVLFLETAKERFELSRMDSGAGGEEEEDVYRWARCIKPLTLSAMREQGVPLPPSHVEVLKTDILWEDLLWGPTGVSVQGSEYKLQRLHFMERKAAGAGGA
mmetsp:Transcript_18237/g.58995  ORF Transcript_18237/g.58995 Transcript_18237/m.58995 type:complete len:415 (+) Transcript_18237:69-1313(+)|eukprot:CAMPEP_0182866838 /NCGR_PEP_ID=MMETSP0034_2-20130328/8407_1 /TAXON_ID=156128 /ORGANISM="Nephroselmis pyriformis, Strain CCMP717" /LENGTH=414 /DNA_ID=CAMNT_0024999171 /DNA_START=70 /DNA_END=1310 /DNA_ORIENTATION=-